MRNIATYESFISKVFGDREIIKVDTHKLKEVVDYVLQEFVDDNDIVVSTRVGYTKLVDSEPKHNSIGPFSSDWISVRDINSKEYPVVFSRDDKNCIVAKLYCGYQAINDYLVSKDDTIDSMSLGYIIGTSSISSKVEILFWFKK